MTTSSDHLNFNSNGTTAQSVASTNYLTLGSHICTTIMSIIYAMGYIGNTFALITFSSKRLRRISSSIFLLAIAISDIGALLTSLWIFLSDAFGIPLQNYSALACRFRTFFAYVFMDLSSWCIAGLAFDRYLRIRFPFGSKSLCTPRNAFFVVLTFVLVLCGINGHYFSPGIGQERGENRSTAHCLENRDTYPNYYYFYKRIWPKIDMIIFCFLPACIMILCNANIIYLRKKQLDYVENTNSFRSKKETTQINTQQTLNGILSTRKVFTAHRRSMERQMSLMMAACVIVFICTTVPVTICLILLEEFTIKDPNRKQNNDFYLLIFRTLRALMYVHFGSNFYLYCLTSRIFRAEFFQTITCQKFPEIPSKDQSTNIALNKISDV
ncbi:unnamed protein product [Rotaria socialis]|uniref:G-protein coupled receptors family 1 profile domain-containing protein n=1 Tax=Rotaria socialis TaxID=392032 RepID=A0A817UHT4_9BILA|nr:unnamed protein product [Rotaria socialis]CAF3330658.1 unnamed protein product [Rotaria socialis]CAF3427665.1 unnamed protein product [Rotaria socialis]CAF3772785.1 unnamed protein product [Rotaria socialis]CAF4339287.1 unnamed protein product [Rotaria socialis]